MLRREASVSYRPLRRRLAAYTFAALIIGAAAFDSTVFAPEPRETRVAAPVEVEPPTSVEIELAPLPAEDALAPAETPIQWLDGERAANQIDLDGFTYKLFHERDDGARVGIRIKLDRACARGVLNVQNIETNAAPALHAALPMVSAYLPDGIYRVWVDCDGRPTRETKLRVIRGTPH